MHFWSGIAKSLQSIDGLQSSVNGLEVLESCIGFGELTNYRGEAIPGNCGSGLVWHKFHESEQHMVPKSLRGWPQNHDCEDSW
jgi:hypothetical protein